MYDRKGPDKWILENDSECDRAGEWNFKQIVGSYVLPVRTVGPPESAQLA
jgi:hypothetical protein